MKKNSILIISILLTFIVYYLYKNVGINWQFPIAFLGGAATLFILIIIDN